MKSMIIRGKSDEGKSTTIRALCESLNPEKVWKLNINHQSYSKSELIPASVSEIFNNTFVIQVNENLLLVCAGAPTEQSIRIMILIQICIAMDLTIDFAIVSMRSVERKKGFDTPAELEAKSKIVHRERIIKIEDENFEDTLEWKNRIESLRNIILRALR